jgi:hypothetical protein
MHDERDGGEHRDGSRHEHGHEEHGGEGCGARGGGPDTRFLQLEMSQVLYGEAENVARPAFRELLLEAAKARLRERFGDKITALADLAVDELMTGMLSSLEIESRIQQRDEERTPTQERLHAIFAERGERGTAGRTRPSPRPKTKKR